VHKINEKNTYKKNQITTQLSILNSNSRNKKETIKTKSSDNPNRAKYKPRADILLRRSNTRKHQPRIHQKPDSVII